MGRFVIEYNPIILIIITRPYEVGKSVYLRSEADQQIIADILTKAEMERLVNGWTVEVADDEPRANTLTKLWERATSDVRERQRSGKSGWRKTGKIIAEAVVGNMIILVFLLIFANPNMAPGDNPNAALTFAFFLSFGWCPLFWPALVPGWAIGWTVFALIGQLRRSK